MKINNINDLVDKVNRSLGDFCRTFAYSRKKLANLGRAPATDRLFEYDNNSRRDWAINQGGGTEIQFHLFLKDNECGYGLGFNAQYVPFNNEKTPKEYMLPFAQAYMRLKDSDVVKQLKQAGFVFQNGKEEELIQFVNDYYLFGKIVKLDANNELSQNDFDQIIADIKGNLFTLYCAIFEQKNKENTEMIAKHELVDLLCHSNNLILTGAPGTGKTYLAREIAKALTGDPEGKHWDFIQFHPSYDYTDFVEGLRPTPPDENGNVGFKLTEGIFKAFCRKAINSSFDNGQDNFDESWQKLVDALNEKDFLKVTNLSGKGEFEIELNEYGTGLASRTYTSDAAKADHNWLDGHSKFFSKDQLYNIYRGLPGVPGGGHDNYRKAVINMLKNDFGLIDYKVGVQKTAEDQKYVFIIDEINRGDIAKIFGELFFALDPGYRGEKGRVKTQYTNMIDDNDIFKAGFFIPKNVYIIGTMNDIDRNVESMDFAIRRRFTWKEIKPEDNLGMWDDPEHGIPEYKDRALKYMTKINETIAGISGLGRAYQLGASYFLKLREYEGNFESLWNYHIQPLLNEYLRGLPNANAEMDKLEAAWKSALSTPQLTDAEIAPMGNGTQA